MLSKSQAKISFLGRNLAEVSLMESARTRLLVAAGRLIARGVSAAPRQPQRHR